MALGELPLRTNNQLPIFPRLIVEHLTRAGVTEYEIFRALDFSNQDLAREDFRLTMEQHERFIKRAIALTGNPHLALEMKDYAFEATSSAVLILFATSGRVSKALRLITHYNPIYTRTLSSSLVEMETGPVLVVDPHLNDEAVTYFALSSFTVFLDTFFQTALNGAHLVKHARLALPEPKGFTAVRDRFGFAVTFDCPRTEIHLARELIDKPLKTADPQTTRLITEYCEKQLADLNAEVSMSDAVSSLIIEHISAPPNLSEAAIMIGLSARSLRRHLQSEGTTYQLLLNEARRTLSIKLLRETTEPVSAIAYEIGFEHPSHFGRAFKKWTGQSPSDFRARL